MTDRIFIKTETDEFIHFDRAINGYTLCGLETAGDDGINVDKGQKTTARVNCPTCIDMVIYCKAIRSREYVEARLTGVKR